MHKKSYSVAIFTLFIVSGCSNSNGASVLTDDKKADETLMKRGVLEKASEKNNAILDKDLGYGWSIKSQEVYFKNKVKKEFDSASFKVLSQVFVKDKTKVYLCFEDKCNKINRDPETFETVEGALFQKDKNGVYENNDKLDGADPQSFAKIKSEFDTRYYKDNSSIYYLRYKLSDADQKTFEVVNANFGRDRKLHYFHDKPLSFVDYQTFTLLKDGFYAKDKKSIYFCSDVCKVISDVDYATFRVVRFAVAEDINNGYIGDRKLDRNSDEYRLVLLRTDQSNCNADIYQKAGQGSYVEKGGGFGVDKNCLYFHGNVISGSHAASFEMLADGYVKDRNRAYYAKPEDVVVGRTDDVDPSSFRVLGGGYARDKDRLYYKMQLSNASDNDLDSFKSIDPKSNRWGFDGEDKSVYYKNGQATFKFLLIQ